MTVYKKKKKKKGNVLKKQEEIYIFLNQSTFGTNKLMISYQFLE